MAATRVKQRNSVKTRTCKYCGAPVTSEVCTYCGNPTGVNTSKANVEYPVLECNEAHLNFWGTVFPAAFALGFGGFGLWFPLFMWATGEIEIIAFVLLFPFAIVGIVATFIVVRNIWLFLSVALFGKRITGTVYGYMDDNVLLNGNPAQVCKILLRTKKGPRFIMYQLGDTQKKYAVNDKIHLKVYKNRFMIVRNNNYDAWE